MPAESEEVYNKGASTSASAESLKEEKKKNAPWIEKYRPQVFEEIMGK
jgi:hypothetical protein